jgi:23S rRNA (guanosine2251-2'-O)-methyltransferase
VVLDGVQDAGNVGGILRTAAAAGVGAVFVPRHRAAGLTEGVARAAAGTLGRVPVVRERNLADLVSVLRERGVACWALDPEEGRPWDRTDLSGPIALVAGSEDKGVRRLVRERCDGSLKVPLAPEVGSLNVGVALAVVLFEVLRQRRAPGEENHETAG